MKININGYSINLDPAQCSGVSDALLSQFNLLSAKFADSKYSEKLELCQQLADIGRVRAGILESNVEAIKALLKDTFEITRPVVKDDEGNDEYALQNHVSQADVFQAVSDRLQGYSFKIHRFSLSEIGLHNFDLEVDGHEVQGRLWIVPPIKKPDQVTIAVSQAMKKQQLIIDRLQTMIEEHCQGRRITGTCLHSTLLNQDLNRNVKTQSSD